MKRKKARERERESETELKRGRGDRECLHPGQVEYAGVVLLPMREKEGQGERKRDRKGDKERERMLTPRAGRVCRCCTSPSGRSGSRSRRSTSRRTF